MKYSKTICLKDGRTCIIRNGTQQDAQGVWDKSYGTEHSRTHRAYGIISFLLMGRQSS